MRCVFGCCYGVLARIKRGHPEGHSKGVLGPVVSLPLRVIDDPTLLHVMVKRYRSPVLMVISKSIDPVWYDESEYIRPYDFVRRNIGVETFRLIIWRIFRKYYLPMLVSMGRFVDVV